MAEPALPQRPLHGWAGSLLGLDELDAYQLVSRTGLAPVGNVCDSDYTMVGKPPKSLLGGATAYEGLHASLRATAAAYLTACGR